jgi:hypothetical protein
MVRLLMRRDRVDERRLRELIAGLVHRRRLGAEHDKDGVRARVRKK